MPVGLRDHLGEHEVFTAREMGWDEVEDGILLDLAEEARFDVMITADQRIPREQNLRDRRVFLVVLNSNRWVFVSKKIPEIRAAFMQTSDAGFVLIHVVPPVKRGQRH